MKHFKKLIILILIQSFLVINTASAGGFELNLGNKTLKSILSPRINIDVNDFECAYDSYVQKISMLDIFLSPGADLLKQGPDSKKKGEKFNFESLKEYLIPLAVIVVSIPKILFAGGFETILNYMPLGLINKYDFLDAVIVGMAVILGMALLRVLMHFKHMLEIISRNPIYSLPEDIMSAARNKNDIKSIKKIQNKEKPVIQERKPKREDNQTYNQKGIMDDCIIRGRIISKLDDAEDTVFQFKQKLEDDISLSSIAKNFSRPIVRLTLIEQAS